ncbi:TPA: hypothetical protein ACG5JQ_000343 [Stenotrophomonas maltophilia]|uniref:hypothetical protein n=1 Tax=Stenotrophomonas maltophilia TaxID=40324 RepID=UPI0013D9AC44|nr:hypothetical protein [Stenotrophomonas maltophilia]HDX0925510.1 hypothetical protein [Stenotrophomonas maltophilia]
MANFEWLNDIPEAEWEKHGLGFSRSFDHDWFMDKCQIRGNDRWREEFDIWGSTQPRGYEHFDRPGRLELVAWGDWTTQDA